jgi:energy-coupling factor transport system permease protein
MALIEYHKGDSLLHKLDPRVKMILLVVFTMVVFMVKSFVILGILFLCVLLLWKRASLPLGRIKKYMAFMFGMVIFLIVIQSLFMPGNINLVKPLIPEFSPILPGRGFISLKGILMGVLLGFRLFVLIMLMPTFVMTTTVNEMALGMVRLGLPYRIAYLATTSINMIPSLQDEARTIMDAQKMRGFSVFEEGRFRDKMKAYPALVVPLVIGAMRRAQAMGVAMDARAFGARKERTYRKTLHMTKLDWVSSILLILLAALLVAGAFYMDKEVPLWNNL